VYHAQSEVAVEPGGGEVKALSVFSRRRIRQPQPAVVVQALGNVLGTTGGIVSLALHASQV
jgi:hypothetical protein